MWPSDEASDCVEAVSTAPLQIGGGAGLNWPNRSGVPGQSCSGGNQYSTDTDIRRILSWDSPTRLISKYHQFPPSE